MAVYKNENSVWIPDLEYLLLERGNQSQDYQEGRASCQLHKSDSFNMLNMMSATVLTVHAIISAVNSQNNNTYHNNSSKNNNNANTNMIMVMVMNMNNNMVGRNLDEDDLLNHPDFIKLGKIAFVYS